MTRHGSLGRILIGAAGGVLLSLCFAATGEAATTVTCEANTPSVGQTTMRIEIDGAAATSDTITLTGNSVVVTPSLPGPTACTTVDGLIIEGDEQDNTVVYDDASAHTFVVIGDLQGADDTFSTLDAQPVDVDGGPGVDTLTGGTGNDVLKGRAGNDVLNGKPGDDVLMPGGDAGSAVGGESPGEVDTVSFADVAAGVTLVLGGGSTVTPVTGGSTGTIAEFENATGGAGVDSLTGDGTDNVLIGNGAVDTLTGGIGDDTLVGADGSDVLVGGDGSDILKPGTGAGSAVAGETGDATPGDTVSFDDIPAPTGVTLTLAGGVVASTVTGDYTGTIAGFENVTGTSARDVITGDSTRTR